MTAPRSILIIGASRGLGLGLTREFAAQGWAVTATVRSAAQQAQAPLQELGVRVEQLEMTDPNSLEQLANRLNDQQFDVIFVNAGVAGPEHHSTAQASAEEMGQLFLTNAVAPLRVAERLLPNLAAEHGLIVFMSSILGSIEA
ncbi:MAG: short-chain dehydrogenase, partial [Ectopseudomonas oleovorans]